jgi:hypothetical protein
LKDAPASAGRALPGFDGPGFVLGVVAGVPGRGGARLTAPRAYCDGMDNEQAFPVIRQTVLDTTDPRRLAEFYRQLFGLRYCPGDEPPAPGQPDPKGQDWLILTSPAGGATLAFQKVGQLPGATWPDGPVPQQLHLDTTVPTEADLDVAHERALALGARLIQDRSDDPEEPLRVYADPAGHPFCIIAAI